MSDSSVSSTISSSTSSTSTSYDDDEAPRKRGQGTRNHHSKKSGRRVKVRFDVHNKKRSRDSSTSSERSNNQSGLAADNKSSLPPGSNLVNRDGDKKQLNVTSPQNNSDPTHSTTKEDKEKRKLERQQRKEAKKKNEAALGVGAKKMLEMQEDFLFSISPQMLKKHEKQALRFISEVDDEEGGQSSSPSSDDAEYVDENGVSKLSPEELKARLKRKKERKRRKKEAEEEEERKRSKILYWYSRKQSDYAEDSDDTSTSDSFESSFEVEKTMAQQGAAAAAATTITTVLGVDPMSSVTGENNSANLFSLQADMAKSSSPLVLSSFGSLNRRKKTTPGHNSFVPNVEKGTSVKTSYFCEVENANETQALRLGIFSPKQSPSSKSKRSKGKNIKRYNEEEGRVGEGTDVYNSNEFGKNSSLKGANNAASTYSTQPFAISSLLALFSEKRSTAGVKDDLIDVSTSHSDVDRALEAEESREGREGADRSYRKRKKRPLWKWLSGGAQSRETEGIDPQGSTQLEGGTGGMGSIAGSGGGLYDSDDEGKTFSRLMRPAAGSNTGTLKAYSDAYYIDHPDVVGERRRHVVSAPSYRLSIITFAEDETIKRELNEQFVLQHPSLEAKLLKLTHIRRLKMELLQVAIGDPNSPIDISTVAHAIWYLERLVEAQRVTKSNRKTVAAVCLLLAIKFWETGLATTSKNSLKAKIQYGIDRMEQRLGVNPKKAKESEFRVYAALDFSLLATTSAVKKHILRLLQVMHTTPSEYYKTK